MAIMALTASSCNPAQDIAPALGHEARDFCVAVLDSAVTSYNMGGREEFFKPPLFYLPASDEGSLHLFNTQKGRIVTFDDRGRFLNAFGSYANGPGEFSKSHDKVLKVFEDSVYVLEIDRRAIGVYGKDGQFRRSVKLPMYACNFTAYWAERSRRWFATPAAE